MWSQAPRFASRAAVSGRIPAAEFCWAQRAGVTAKRGAVRTASLQARTLSTDSFYSSASGTERRRATTILCVRKGGHVVMIGDGQVSQGSTVCKGTARKVRLLTKEVLCGFAGSTADAFILTERLEKKLEEHSGQLERACVELAKAWRSEKYFKDLEATIVVADIENTFELTGRGDVLKPDHPAIAIGSGGLYAFCAARALLDLESCDLDAEAIARRAMTIAADTCVYTNHNFTMQKLEPPPAKDSTDPAAPSAFAKAT